MWLASQEMSGFANFHFRLYKQQSLTIILLAESSAVFRTKLLHKSREIYTLDLAKEDKLYCPADVEMNHKWVHFEM